jgi:SPX domain protein involved in polyphosphate accumulation
MIQVKSREISGRIEENEAELDRVVNEQEPSEASREEQFMTLEEEASDVIADVHDLEKYTRLNYTAFQKIVKKHDKKTSWTLKPIFAARLNAKPFYKENYDAVVVKVSRLYDTIRSRGNPIKGDSTTGAKQQNVRK